MSVENLRVLDVEDDLGDDDLRDLSGLYWPQQSPHIHQTTLSEIIFDNISKGNILNLLLFVQLTF